jgi:hypothetical protein
VSRVSEIRMTPGTKSRLTVTSTRVTVKVCGSDGEMYDELYLAGHAIAELIDSEKSLRGVFDTDHRRISMYFANGENYKTYSF